MKKKTKKNLSLMKDMKDVIDVVKQPTLITRVKPIKEPIVINVPEPVVVNAPEPIIEGKKKEKEKEIVKEHKTTKEVKNYKDYDINTNDTNNTNNTNTPYKYYTKKDIKKNNLNVSWPPEDDLYDRDTFTDNLTLLLNIQPLFSLKCIKQSAKDNKTLADKINILQNVYYFKKINKIKETIIELIYTLLVYDDTIKFII